MRIQNNTRSLTISFGSLFSIESKWLPVMLLAAFILVLSTVHPMAQVVIDEETGIASLAVEKDPTDFDIDAALAQLEEELGASIEESSVRFYDERFVAEMANSAEYSVAYLYVQRNNMLRSKAAIAALEMVKVEETLRSELQALQLANGAVVPVDEHLELQGDYYAIEEKLTFLKGDYKVLHAALEAQCGADSFRTANPEACGIVLGTAKHETN